MSDGARQGFGRRADDNLAGEIDKLKQEIAGLNKLLALEQALRRAAVEDLARYHRRAGAVIDDELKIEPLED